MLRNYNKNNIEKDAKRENINKKCRFSFTIAIIQYFNSMLRNVID